MTKNFAVYRRDGLLYTRTLTELKARKLALQIQGTYKVEEFKQEGK